MKYRKLSILLLVLFVLSVCLVPINRTVNKSYLCTVLDQQDESFVDEVTVVFTGKYSDYLLRRDKFVGQFELEGYEFLDPHSDDCTFYVKNYEENYIHEYVINAGHAESNILGTFYATEDFDSFFLWVMVPNDLDAGYSGGAYGRYFITHPDMTFEEIYSILDKNNA